VVTVATRVSEADVRAAIDGVPDPEMPPVSVAELGMVEAVRVDGDRVEVELVPTFSGCPATAVIRDDVAAAVRELPGVVDVTVRFRRDVAWEPARITAAGRDKLRGFGIAPPCTQPGSPPVAPLPLAQIGRATAAAAPPVPCPLCGSGDTTLDSPFGPTPCRSTYYCRACRNPFEAIKD
jgi:ring-1,2-phenylacetyl-CoA epoxidase subunit PaaD